ncbi:MAG: ABC-F family ATP-binding cassette domain-containing protein [Deltaproteobacteria bacterium]|nr:ABC-F family ATP-binding cassette domain-containing protein [Deltaproteobacteria bacterium]
MISLNNLSKQFNGKSLFHDVSIHIGKGDRVALVGPNGAGKSTLMKIIVGQIVADTGTINQSRFNTAGYLPQDGIYHAGKTLFEEVATVFKDINSLQERMTEIFHELQLLTEGGTANSPEIAELVEELGKAQHTIEHHNGYAIEARIKQILFGLGFTESDLKRTTDEFSGGWQMRIEIAKLLLMEPTILLLDEPTNHLDIDSLEWLETYLQSYKGAVILVSHDSRFLDNLVNKIIEISMGNVTQYTGNFSSYIKQKELRDKQISTAYEQQQKLIEKTGRFIGRYRYDKKRAKLVQSRLKTLEKMKIIEKEHDDKTISFDFPESPRTGRVVMELNNLTKSYGSNTVFKDISLRIDRGDKIALLGINGSGKSTLARIIAGTEPFQEGEHKPGHNVMISYFAQNMADSMNPDRTVLETVDTAAPSASPQKLRTMLGCFLFSGDDVFKPVSVLSGGEKSRLALARMLLIPANFLIFDEPTNHLDAQSKVVLQRSLQQFVGSYLIISHDRDFLVPLINKVMYLKNGNVTLYPGTVDDYLFRAKREDDEGYQTKELAKKKPSQNFEKTQKRKAAEQRQELYRQLKPLRDARNTIEVEISRAEGRKGEIEKAFADTKTYEDEKFIQNLHIEHDKVASQLKDLYDQWVEIEGKIEQIVKKYM